LPIVLLDFDDGLLGLDRLLSELGVLAELGEETELSELVVFVWLLLVIGDELDSLFDVLWLVPLVLKLLCEELLVVLWLDVVDRLELLAVLCELIECVLTLCELLVLWLDRLLSVERLDVLGELLLLFELVELLLVLLDAVLRVLRLLEELLTLVRRLLSEVALLSDVGSVVRTANWPMPDGICEGESMPPVLKRISAGARSSPPARSISRTSICRLSSRVNTLVSAVPASVASVSRSRGCVVTSQTVTRRESRTPVGAGPSHSVTTFDMLRPPTKKPGRQDGPSPSKQPGSKLLALSHRPRSGLTAGPAL
jgi:hypothetical protein